jgi:hypothetical protein
VRPLSSPPRDDETVRTTDLTERPAVVLRPELGLVPHAPHHRLRHTACLHVHGIGVPLRPRQALRYITHTKHIRVAVCRSKWSNTETTPAQMNHTLTHQAAFHQRFTHRTFHCNVVLSSQAKGARRFQRATLTRVVGVARSQWHKKGHPHTHTHIRTENCIAPLSSLRMFLAIVTARDNLAFFELLLTAR